MKQDRRRVGEWLLAAGFVLLAWNGWQRVALSLVNWHWLSEADMQPGARYLALSGGVWGSFGLLGLVWLLLRAPGYRWGVLAVGSVYAVTYWIDRLLINQPAAAGDNTAFAVLLTLAELLLLALVLRPWRKPIGT